MSVDRKELNILIGWLWLSYVMTKFLYWEGDEELEDEH